MKIPEDLQELYSEANSTETSHRIYPRPWGSVLTLIERIAALTKERDSALVANELDRRNLNSIVSGIQQEITGRMWLIEGRGPYEWDDDRYRQEFGWAIGALREKLKPLADIAGDLTNSPKNESGVERVRKLEALEADNAALRAELERLSAPVSDSELAPYSASGTRGLMLIDSKGVTALLAARKEKP